MLNQPSQVSLSLYWMPLVTEVKTVCWENTVQMSSAMRCGKGSSSDPSKYHTNRTFLNMNIWMSAPFSLPPATATWYRTSWCRCHSTSIRFPGSKEERWVWYQECMEANIAQACESELIWWTACWTSVKTASKSFFLLVLWFWLQVKLFFHWSCVAV